MSVPGFSLPARKLVGLGLQYTEGVFYQTSPAQLIDQTISLGDGQLNDSGALVILTGEFTGRTPKDKFIVKDDTTKNTVDWNEFNTPINQNFYSIIHKKLMEHLNTQPELWVRDCYACADERYRMNIRLVTEKPWMSLFAYNMFLRPKEDELENFKPGWHIFSAPDLKLDPIACGTRTDHAVVVSFEMKTILIAGTGYTGETKKSIFSVLNFILPLEKNILSMHCSANMGDDGNTAIFFGLSGTGKTTLSADPHRRLIGDDEHGWSDDNIFNFEGGCYAKTINLSKENEPEIYAAIRPGALVENVGFFSNSNAINFADGSVTENTRVSYPLHFITNAIHPSIGKIPNHLFFLTCDAYGVLPPISKLTPGQAMYQFISGYTAKIAGTETGITDPKPTFSACFGAPFLPLHPAKYATMLGEKMRRHNVTVWLINTGWTGGAYGQSIGEGGGSRIKLAYTRAMITAALTGKLDNVPLEKDAVFGLSHPLDCAGVPKEILNPRKAWKNKATFDEKEKFLAGLFNKNFEKYSALVDEETRKSAPVG